jgi:asparagine synthase (glutamine-hydrolysing)
MCGIVGIRDPDSPAEESLARVHRMVEAIRHRGPDGDGNFSDGDVAIGMRRLAVIDLATGDQPIFNQDRSIVAVFNGEIYNYRELRAELAASGLSFATKSDTEVIVQGYARWGEEVFARLNGMFAIALLDRRNRKLVLARDHAGIKPLYYAWDGRRLVWGSEVKALLASGLVSRSMNMEALAEFLAWEYVPCPRTLFADVRKLPPATCWSLDLIRGTVRETLYWQLPEVEEQGTREEEWVERLDTVLTRAVRRQMVSDVPLGAFLSGGVDSSLLVASMGKAETFSIGFEERSYNELAHSQRIATHLGCVHVTEPIRETSLALFPKLIDMLDDPIADTSLLPTFQLSRLARRHVTVVLTGDGADELFGGYETYLAWDFETRYRRLPGWLRTSLLEPAVRQLRPRAAKKGLVNRAMRFVDGLDSPASAGHAKWRMYLTAPQALALLTGDALSAAQPALERDLTRHLAADGPPRGLDWALRADYRSFLLDDILVKLDRSSMATSLEARVPYLDREVVELAFRMPASIKVRNGVSKWVLKQVASRYLPRETVHRPKEGFSAPLKQWLAGHGRELMEDLLDRRTLASQSIFRPERVRELMQEHLSGRRNHAHLLWSLMVFQGWQRRWLNAADGYQA